MPEAPRFFESMVVGRHFSEVATITSRICGICSIGHTFSSLKATEAALGVHHVRAGGASAQDTALRRKLCRATSCTSAILPLPDLLKVNSVFPLIGTHKDVVLARHQAAPAGQRDLRRHRRPRHAPDPHDASAAGPCCQSARAEALKKRLQEAIGDFTKLGGLVESLAGGIPNFTRETEYIALTEPGRYANYDGMIKSTRRPNPMPLSASTAA